MQAVVEGEITMWPIHQLCLTRVKPTHVFPREYYMYKLENS